MRLSWSAEVRAARFGPEKEEGPIKKTTTGRGPGQKSKVILDKQKMAW